MLKQALSIVFAFSLAACAACAASEEDERQVYSGGDAGMGPSLGGGSSGGGGGNAEVSGECAERFGPLACLEAPHLLVGLGERIIDDRRSSEYRRGLFFEACGRDRATDEPVDTREILAEDDGCIAHTGAVGLSYSALSLDAGLITVDAEGDVAQFELGQNCYEPVESINEGEFYDAQDYGITAQGTDDVDSFMERVSTVAPPEPTPVAFRAGRSFEVQWPRANVNQLAVVELEALNEETGAFGRVTCYVEDDGIHRVPASVTDVFPEGITRWDIRIRRTNLAEEPSADPSIFYFFESEYRLTYDDI